MKLATRSSSVRAFLPHFSALLRSRIHLAFALAVSLLLVFTGSVMAQTGTTSIRGVVTDPSARVIVGAKVTLKSVAQEFERVTETSSDGGYQFLQLAPGEYSMLVESAGFKTLQKTKIVLIVNFPSTINVAMEVGAISEIVTVSARDALLNTRDASLGIGFDETQVKQLPLDGRNVPDLLSLQAGVTYTGNRSDVDDLRTGSVNGARNDQSNVTVDGIPVNDEGGHPFTSVLPVTLDSVQEFRVTTSNYNSDEGTSSGAQVQLITKSGTDKFHGSVYEYHRNTATSANDYFIKQAQLSSGEPNSPPKLIRNVFGASVGGPLRRKGLYFFLNYEGARRAEEQAAVALVPTASFRDGVIQYLCTTNADGTLDTASCPGGSVTGLSGQTYSVAPGYAPASPGALASMDPLQRGASQGVLDYLNNFPLPNSLTAGGGDGVNTAGLNWRAPFSDSKNSYIGRLDFITKDDKHRVSISGASANESSPGVPFYPGQEPSTTFVNHSKGIIVQYSSTLRPSLLNSFRYGFIRESIGNLGITNQPQTYLTFGLNLTAYSSSFQRPTHTFADDLTWIKGHHSLQFGTQISFIREPRQGNSTSFSSADTEPFFLDSAISQNPDSPLNPVNYCPGSQCLPGVDPSFATSYDWSVTSLLGVISKVDAVYNYGRDANVLAQGVPTQRRFAINSYEFYLQDSWKVRPSLTLNYGLRYSLFSPPWETNGLQVSPTENLGAWLKQRESNMLAGRPSNLDTPIAYDWSGPANGKPGFYDWDYRNLAPRFGFAWAPTANRNNLFGSIVGNGKTVVRGGFSFAYDRFGQGLVDTYDQTGSFGLNIDLPNPPAAAATLSCAPRVVDINVMPTGEYCGFDVFPSAPAANFPQPFPSGAFLASWGMDRSMKTPYAYTFNLSVARELGAGFQIQASYVGRLGRHLLSQQDFAMPFNLYDPASKTSYYAAATALARIYRSGVTTSTFDPTSLPPAIQEYWTNIIAPLAPGGAYLLGTAGGCGSDSPTSTTSPVVMAFDLFCATSTNETLGLEVLDYFGIPDANDSSAVYFPSGGQFSFYNPQYSTLYGWRTTGTSNYNSLQLSLQHRMQQGIQFDVNYTYSKSIDTASDPERAGGSPYNGLLGAVVSTWNPNGLRGPSDFDLRHQLNANWIWEIPFGKGRRFGTQASGIAKAFLSDWQLSGLFRMTSGFPISINNGYAWATNWTGAGNANQDSPVHTGAFKKDGYVSLFANGSAGRDSFSFNFPGQSGQRNELRGDGYFGWDMSLSKRWIMPWLEGSSLQFRWEVFNVPNATRFNVETVTRSLTDSPQTFGNYNGLLTSPRVMQFALRYDF